MRLYLTDNELEDFDTSDLDNQLPLLYVLTIVRNGLKTFSWEGCPTDMRTLNLNMNKLAAIPKLDEHLSFTNFGCLREISLEGTLGENQLSFLPVGFEDLPKLRILKLSSNNFNFNDSNLDDVLWLRLPKSLTTLHLSHNTLGSIPCYLKNYKLTNLHIDDCDLHHICPYLHTHVQASNSYLVINVSNNPELSLPFVPSTIYKLPKADVKAINGVAKIEVGIPNYANFPTTTIFDQNDNFRNTERTKYTKLVYEFSTENVEQASSCNCCASCGEYTDELLFKQQMAMDSILMIQEKVIIISFHMEKKLSFCAITSIEKKIAGINHLVFSATNFL